MSYSTYSTLSSMGARAWRLALAGCMLLALLAVSALPAHAKDRATLPAVNNFATAQFKLLTTVSAGDTQISAYGGGAVVLPDRTSVWLSTDQSQDMVNIVQIGSTTYQRLGASDWQRTENGNTVSAQPVSAQFNLLQQAANSIEQLPDEMIGDVPASHFQVWLSGEKLLELSQQDASMVSGEARDLLKGASIKYDLWVGTQDGFLHQQQMTLMMQAGKVNGVSIPSSQTTVLLTYFDINDPNISVNAPI